MSRRRQAPTRPPAHIPPGVHVLGAKPPQATIQQMIAGLQQQNRALDHAFKESQMERSKVVGILIALLSSHACFHVGDRPMPEVSLSLEAIRQIGEDIGVDWKTQGDQLIVSLKTNAQLKQEAEGQFDINQIYSVPVRPPFSFLVSPPQGGKYKHDYGVQYEGGKNPKLFNRVERKPKLHEYRVDSDGRYYFSDESAGLDVRVAYAFELNQKAAEQIEEESVQPLTCNNDWHFAENDGEKIIGRCCEQCGDSRKVLPLK